MLTRVGRVDLGKQSEADVLECMHIVKITNIEGRRYSEQE